MKLKPTCVELSRAALRFRGRQASTRQVQVALDTAFRVLSELAQSDSLDEKLAEYAFYPLQLIFNEARRISSDCLELAVRYLQILVAKGWRSRLNPEMGKQLLILLSLVAGAVPGDSTAQAPSEELKLASISCMNDIAINLGQTLQGKAVLNDQGTKNLVDQIVYMLLAAVTDSPSPAIQLAASKALESLYTQISSRLMLASLLPRTVSSLTKALRSSTQIRRTYKVLVAGLQLLESMLHAVLNDTKTFPDIFNVAATDPASLNRKEDRGILDSDWLQATASQVKLALTHIVQLRYHRRLEVREAAMQLCLMIVKDCRKSLADSLTLVIETLVVLADNSDDATSVEAESTLNHLVISDTAIYQTLRDRLLAWVNSFPRVMQSSDERPKERLLKQISTTSRILSYHDSGLGFMDESLAIELCNGVAIAIRRSFTRPAELAEDPSQILTLLSSTDPGSSLSFPPIILDQRSEEGSLAELQSLLLALSKSGASTAVIRALLSQSSLLTDQHRLAAIWLVLGLLRQNKESSSLMSDFLDISPMPVSSTRPYLVEEIYGLNLPTLLDPASCSDWRLLALSLEILVLQAQQLGQSYRPELMESLYPVLQLLGSNNPLLRNHARTALNLLSAACGYERVSDMLIQNVDYLINSVGLKLTYGEISPQAAQVLLMMVRLCGAALIPYLDDTISSMFDLLDQYHGYPKLVEMLFAVLGTIVDEGARKPQLAIANGREAPQHKKLHFKPSSIDDILEDLQRRKDRSTRLDPSIGDNDSSSTISAHPRRPWTSAEDSVRPDSGSIRRPSESEDGNQREEQLPLQEEKPIPLSPSHSLLLNILTACPPHLSSPSSQVRLTILNLIIRVVPLLASDETTLLPAIHAIWPSIVSRLFPPKKPSPSQPSNNTASLLLSSKIEPDLTNTNGDTAEDQKEEPIYTTTSSIRALSALCVAAGDFLTSRLEALFPELEALYLLVWESVSESLSRREKHAELAYQRSGSQPTKLEVVGTGKSSLGGADGQIHREMMKLWCTILQYVHIKEEIGGMIAGWLAEVVVRNQSRPNGLGLALDFDEMRETVEGYNADILWLARTEAEAGTFTAAPS